jgi:purine catabolism regulator
MEPRKTTNQSPTSEQRAERTADPILMEEFSLQAVLRYRIQTVSRLLLDGGGLLPLLDAIESMFDNPAAVLAENGTCWLSLGLRRDGSAEIAPILRRLSESDCSGAPGAPGGAGTFLTIEGDRQAYAAPLMNKRSANPAYLVLFSRRREISRLDRASIDRIAALVGMEVENAEAARAVETRYFGRFLEDWLSGRIPTAADWKRRAELCRWSVPDGTRLSAVRVGPQTPADAAGRLKDAAFRIGEALGEQGVKAASVDGELALIVSLPGDVMEEDADSALEARLRQWLSDIRDAAGVPALRLYAGSAAAPGDLPASWLQAARARRVAERSGLAGDVHIYGKLGVYPLLDMIPEGEERERFLRRFADPLKQADRRGGGRLSETLEMFFRCNGNIKLTSEKLYAHYNTVVYRLEKIQQILGVSLDDPEDRFQLQMALKLGMMSAPH